MRLRPLTRCARLCLCLVAGLAAEAGAQELAPRRPLAVGAPRATPLPPELAARAHVSQRLVVKFADLLRVRAVRGELVSEPAPAELRDLRALARREGLRFRPLIALPAERLAELEARASERSGRAQPDLAGMLVVEAQGADTARLEALGAALAAQAGVEFVHVETLGVPPPGDVAPPTPDLALLQAYVAPDPGLDVAWAHAQGYRGQGVRLSDCEYGWNPVHEELVDIDLHPEPGQTIHPSVFSNGWEAHGTAVVGGAAAQENGYGITGVADGVQLHTYTEWSVEQGPRRMTAIATALGDSDPGDVVLLEMQALGAGSGYAPAEVDPAVFVLVRLGVDAGVIVVAAAGNGNQDLDSPAYATWRGWGHSGAILVGAGSASTSHDRLSFSTFGSRIDVQGWGTGVFTLGYGSFAQYGGDPNQSYTASFNGTSSASGLVAPVCALLQSAAVATTGQRLSALAMRQVLVATGRAQGGGGGPIGPLPDVRAAIQALPTLVVADFAATPLSGDAPLAVAFLDRSFGAGLSWQWDFGDGTTSDEREPSHVYLQPGVYDVRLTVSGPAGADTLALAGLVQVAPPLTLSSVAPLAIPALVPGTAQMVTVGGTALDTLTQVSIDGSALSPASYTVVDDTTLTLDLPQLGALGAHTLGVASAAGQASLPLSIVAPATPVLQVGNGDGFATNLLSAGSGAGFLVGGQVGETHWILYSTQALPSVLSGLIALDIGAGFAFLDFVQVRAIGPAGWSFLHVPFTPTFALIYFQSFTLDQGRPLVVSNVQSAVLLP